jgi:hypothetical protein
MSFCASIQISIESQNPARLNILQVPIEDLDFTVIFNNIASTFKSPFNALPVDLYNFPLVSVLKFGFLSKGSCIAQGECNIERLKRQKSLELCVNIYKTENLESPESFRPKDNTLIEENTLKLNFFIEKIENDQFSHKLNTIINNFHSIDQETLKIAVDINKNIEVYRVYKDFYGIEMINGDDIDINPQNLKNYKCLVLGLNEKLKTLEIFKQKYESLAFQVAKDQKNRDFMQAAYSKNCKDFVTHQNSLQNAINALSQRCETLESENQRLKSLELEYKHYKETQITLLETQIVTNESILITKSLETPFDLISNLKCQLSKEQERSAHEKSIFLNTIQDYQKVLSEHQDELKSLIEENSKLLQEINKVNEENNKLIENNENLVTKIISFESCIQNYETQLKYYQELKDFDHKTDFIDTIYTEKPKIFQTETPSPRNSEEHKRTKSFSLLHSNKTLTETNKKLMQELTQARNEIFGLESAAKTFVPININKPSLEISETLLEDIKSMSLKFQRNDQSIVDEYSELTSNLLQSSERELFLQRTLTRLISFLQNKSAELQIMQKLLIEAEKEKQIYIPVRGDIIDNTLANYLNSMNKKLDIPFIRLDNGVYLFGNKKVILRIENIGIVSNF